MNRQFARTALLIGEDALDRLQKSRVAVFGIGGVGGYTVEALARSGVGALDLIDNDTVSITNLNRQIIALHSTVGQYKVDVAAARIHDINPDCRSSARWGRATSSTRPPLRSAISAKRPFVRLRA